MDADDLYAHDRCDRCGHYLGARAMSYFTEDFLCMDCLRRENLLILELRLRNVDIAGLASCGYLPDPASLPAGPGVPLPAGK